MINIKDYTTEQKAALLKKYKKFVLTGTHNSGKSTILTKYVNNPLFYCVGEMIRELSKAQGITFVPDCIVEYLESEKMLFNFYKSMYEANHYKSIDKYFLYDRNIADPLYYIKNTIENDLRFNDDATREQKKYLSSIYDYGFKEFTRMKYEGFFDATLFLLLDPINEITDDGFRIIDPVVQTNVYNIAVAILESVRVDYISLSANECVSLLDLVDNVKWN